MALIGTLAVRRYLQGVDRRKIGVPALERVESTFPTSGPANRFGAVLFIEKEGFDEILKAARIAERYDIAIMSTKVMSVTASRLLVDRLHVPLLVLHDFDQSGFSIIGTLRRSTRRYRFSGPVNVIDLGLTLADIERYGLQAEDQRLAQGESTLRQNGATPADIGQESAKWSGLRQAVDVREAGRGAATRRRWPPLSVASLRRASTGWTKPNWWFERSSASSSSSLMRRGLAEPGRNTSSATSSTVSEGRVAGVVTE